MNTQDRTDRTPTADNGWRQKRPGTKQRPRNGMLRPYMTRGWFEEFWTPEPNTGCWLWLGSTDFRGYGHVETGRAHRVAWELYVGRLPTGAHVLHKCDTPACVNPSHLELGNASKNIADMWRRGRRQPEMLTALGETHSVAEWARITGIEPRRISRRVKAGWAPDEAVTVAPNPRNRARLTVDKVREIRRLVATVSQRKLAKQFGVSMATITDIVHGRTWKDAA